MTEIARPVVEPAGVALGGLEHFASLPATPGGNIEVDFYRTGSIIEARVTRNHNDDRPSTLLVIERLNIRPSLDSWLKTLLDRAEEGTK